MVDRIQQLERQYADQIEKVVKDAEATYMSVKPLAAKNDQIFPPNQIQPNRQRRDLS